ncbi:MAG: hypothetical protein HYY96_15520 [Candidatus Tectomicrobia bacterium]|nr:hypothetical protein [Candidatus Tectomicrobia bacterium]
MNRSEVKKNLKENKVLRVGEVQIESENDLYYVTINGHALHTDDFELAYRRFTTALKEHGHAPVGERLNQQECEGS